jgi:hypothetical protein
VTSVTPITLPVDFSQKWFRSEFADAVGEQPDWCIIGPFFDSKEIKP